MSSYVERLIGNRNRCSSEEYKEWLYSFVKEHGFISDDEMLYYRDDINEKDKENASIISYAFCDYFNNSDSELFNNKGAESVNGVTPFYTEWFFFTLKDTEFFMETVYGQGSVTTCGLKKDYKV